MVVHSASGTLGRLATSFTFSPVGKVPELDMMTGYRPGGRGGAALALCQSSADQGGCFLYFSFNALSFLTVRVSLLLRVS